MPQPLSELDLAWAALSAERYMEAIQRSDALLRLSPNDPGVVACNALARWRRGEPAEESIASLRRAVALAPGNSQLRQHLGTVLASAGDIEGGEAEFEAALARDPANVEAFFAYAQHFKVRAETAAVADMAQRYESGLQSPIERELCAFALAKAFDDVGDSERAFRYATEANAMVERPFDLAGQRADLETLRQMTEANAFRQVADSGSDAASVFVVGMSRAGTTLVESILSRHPDVLAQGETVDFVELQQAARRRAGDAGGELRPMALLPLIPEAWFRSAAEAVTKLTKARANGAYRVATDKLPDNAVRLGLIEKVFPRARIIYVRRHPLDVGWSNYLRRFTSGQAFSFRLDWIGYKTRLIAETMSLWKRALDLNILDVRYESLVADPEEQIRRIVAFAGLDWNEACLEPQRTGRSIKTASLWQVRQPIGQSSIGRWKPYEAQLAPMIDAMGGWDWINAELDDQARVANRSTSKS
jgi:tetratricopeptide (TPR) repeat protein